MTTEALTMNLTPGTVIDAVANRIASLRSKLGTIEKHKMGRALTGRKRFTLERLEELEALVSCFGIEFKKRVEVKVAELLKPD